MGLSFGYGNSIAKDDAQSVNIASTGAEVIASFNILKAFSYSSFHLKKVFFQVIFVSGVAFCVKFLMNF